MADGELLRAVQAALDLGITFFDTADIYGLGRSEELLGRAIVGRREDAVIATKGGVRRVAGMTAYDNSPEYLTTALHDSLRRLAVEVIDLYQLHYWDERTPLDAIFETLERFREAGKVRAYGVTNLDVAAQVTGVPPALVTYSFEYSLAQRRHHASILRNRKLGLAFLSWGSLGQGVLSGKYGRESVFSPDDRRRRPTYVNFHGERFARNLEIVDAMRAVLPHYPGRSLANVALRWILDTLPGAIVLAGVKRPEQIRDNARALGWSLAAIHVEALTGKSDPVPAQSIT